MFGIFVRNICIDTVITFYLSMEGIYMQQMSVRSTAQIYDFSELQKKKRERELREKRLMFITGAILLISVVSICFFLYFGDRVVRAKESVPDVQYKVVEVEEGDSLWSIAKENMACESNYNGFTDIYQYIREIKKCNNMKSNQINTGSYLMVPYYQ